MKIECETKKINGEGRIVLDDDILKEPNFQMLKRRLGLVMMFAELTSISTNTKSTEK